MRESRDFSLESLVHSNFLPRVAPSVCRTFRLCTRVSVYTFFFFFYTRQFLPFRYLIFLCLSANVRIIFSLTTSTAWKYERKIISGPKCQLWKSFSNFFRIQVFFFLIFHMVYYLDACVLHIQSQTKLDFVFTTFLNFIIFFKNWDMNFYGQRG